ncbi:ABC transporter substrate-binding protein [Pseudodesulfovibrio sp. zrk46]|uniref:ABC transporter substrate-binding protein n=1 Tax=Pseudodesulfovibrio sp. zrk46 TaxID=2725288 RepID=UPI0014495C46|nr:ABC transporter substrate-binding protein [Pseudodesulfovibrio sp. zrk46]QJB58215.1 ABC transporter substrate-binding protein [Pseudodesulfovibrio sp. zrk46]
MKKLFYTLLFLLLFATSARAEQMADDVGTTFFFEKPYTRIISLYAAHTENLFNLGLDTEIIGVSKTEDYPYQALNKPRFSTHDGVEKFLAAKPDLVLIRPMQFRGYPGLWNALKKHGIRVLALQPNTIDEMYKYWRKLGRLTGRELQAERMIGEFKEGIETALQRIDTIPMNERPWVFFESIHKKFATFSPGSMPIFVMKTAGGRNIAADAKPRHGTNIASYGLERMLHKAAKIDVYLAQYGAMNQVEVRRIMNGPAASRIKAVRDRNVFLVDEHLVSRPTMRLLEGINAVHRLLHPGGNH